jgi:hypothetical protein
MVKISKNSYDISFFDRLRATGLLSVSVAIVVLVLEYYPRPSEVKYDCSIAEISPDYPKSVKEECRKRK